MEIDATKRTDDEAVCDARRLTKEISAASNSNPVRVGVIISRRGYKNSFSHFSNTPVRITTKSM